MSLNDLKNWLAFIQDAPESIRSYLTVLVWALVVLTLVWIILKLLFNEQFKQLYSILGASAKVAGHVGKAMAKGAAKSLELPEPYPRIARFFAIVLMINTYVGAFIFACITVFTAVLTVISNTPSFWARTSAMLLVVFFLYFACFLFAAAERDRVMLFLRRSASASG